VAVASAGPYASVHLAPESRLITTPASHHSGILGCPSCHPANSVKALKAILLKEIADKMQTNICKIMSAKTRDNCVM